MLIYAIKNKIPICLAVHFNKDRHHVIYVIAIEDDLLYTRDQQGNDKGHSMISFVMQEPWVSQRFVFDQRIGDANQKQVVRRTYFIDAISFRCFSQEQADYLKAIERA